MWVCVWVGVWVLNNAALMEMVGVVGVGTNGLPKQSHVWLVWRLGDEVGESSKRRFYACGVEFAFLDYPGLDDFHSRRQGRSNAPRTIHQTVSGHDWKCVWKKHQPAGFV
ncbi:uncharacterized protein BDZ99DRAFT_83805 [Mytilinidion resinicola]|uniref:Uncharacterized protein n=1 Tax=Mytilinidion resinicola TaxID=574789 RepID=A0A6A6YF57_9PEZI|nr:uncharacterized protein BDZ99DRAFT_83805 [Mytilinidion resinicola]KAF2806695.1 hypothetical protein BDZ99DRAFT_83805 [Mytilinidion resinicola]